MWLDSLAEMFRRKRHSNRRRRRRVTGARLEGLDARRLLAFHVATEFATAPWPRDLEVARVDSESARAGCVPPPRVCQLIAAVEPGDFSRGWLPPNGIEAALRCRSPDLRDNEAAQQPQNATI